MELAEALDARVITDLKIGAAFPTDHPLHLGAPGADADAEGLAALAEADVILSLDWVDLGGTLEGRRQRRRRREGHQRHARPEHPQRLEHGLPGPRRRSTCSSPADPDATVAALLARSARSAKPKKPRSRAASLKRKPAPTAR